MAQQQNKVLHIHTYIYPYTRTDTAMKQKQHYPPHHKHKHQRAHTTPHHTLTNISKMHQHHTPNMNPLSPHTQSSLGAARLPCQVGWGGLCVFMMAYQADRGEAHPSSASCRGHKLELPLSLARQGEPSITAT